MKTKEVQYFITGSPPTRLFDTGSTQFEPVSPEEDDKNPPIEDGQECTFFMPLTYVLN